MIVLVSVIRRTARTAVLAAALLTTCVACTHPSADKATSSATVRTEPAPTTTTNPYAVPAVIDAAYVNRVLAGLDAQIGDVTRMVVQTKTIPREAYDRLRAIYANDQRLQLALDNFQTDMGRGFVDYRQPPGNKITLTTHLITGRADCIFAEVTRDYTQVGVNARSADMQWVGLRPLNASRDVNGYNQTRWAYEYEGYPPDHSRPNDQCAA